MKTLTMHTVINEWYNMDAYSPGTAKEWIDVASFDTEDEADKYAQILQAEHDYEVKHIPESFSSNEAPEHGKYFVEKREIHLHSSINEIERK
ncbi:MAG: hypothetical protein KAH01_04850 [Caldisericia bacterium]|nr:hypothetical protein [Caldisericia bacterium]